MSCDPERTDYAAALSEPATWNTKPVGSGGHIDCLSVQNISGQKFLSQRVLDIFLDNPLQRAGSVGRIIAFLSQPAERAVVHIEGDLAILQKAAEPLELDLDDVAHLRPLQPVEQDNLIQPVQELGPEVPAHCCHHLVPDRIAVLTFRLVDEVLGTQV